MVDDHFDWSGDRHIRRSLSETVIYEMHIRGFTQHASSGVKHPGTYLGVIDKIPYLKRINEQAKDMEITIALSDEVKDMLVEKGYDPNLGARPLRRAVQRFIEDPLSEQFLMGTFKPGDHLIAELDADRNVVFRRTDAAPGTDDEPTLINN